MTLNLQLQDLTFFTRGVRMFVVKFVYLTGSFSLYIYFIFVDIFPAFLLPQLGRVFAWVFLQGFQIML